VADNYEVPDEPTDSEVATGGAASQESETILERCERASRFLAERLHLTPRLGIVLGSGLGGLAERVERKRCFSYERIPGWPRATAIGHAGQLIVGHLAGVPVAVLQGRLHPYEGHTLDEVTLPIRVLCGLGVAGWVLSNAAGGLNPGFRRGELMAIDGHLDLTAAIGSDRRSRPAAETPRSFDSRSYLGRLPSPYHEPWLERLQRCARLEQVSLHRGTYAFVTGPTYETRAEYRAFRRMGADAVGMSTIPEVRQAARCGTPVLAISVITNEAKPDAPIRNDAADVLATARQAEQGLQRLLDAWLRTIPLGD